MQPLDELFEREPDRLGRLTLSTSPDIHFDWSKTHLDGALLDGFVAARRGAWTSRRAATPCSPARSSIRPRAAPPSMSPSAGRARRRPSTSPPPAASACARWSTRSRRGAFGDVTGILHIGIGGSALGPALLVDALGRDVAGYDVRVLSNIDGEAFDEAVEPSIRRRRLVVVASKTFTTTETLPN